MFVCYLLENRTMWYLNPELEVVCSMKLKFQRPPPQPPTVLNLGVNEEQ
jgi:hypothetical protein